MHYQLVSTEGDQTFELRAGAPLIVGRALNSDIPVLDPTISRRHAEVRCDDAGGVQVKDLGSSNGTFVNGAQVQEARVAPGDLVTFGKVPFRLAEVRPVEAAPPPPQDDAFAGMRPGATIVRMMPVRHTGDALGALRPSGPRAAAEGEPEKPASTAERDQDKLRLLIFVATQLTKAVTVDELLDKIGEQLFVIFDIDRVAILLMDERGDLVPKVSRDKRGQAAGQSVPRSILRTAIDQRAAVLSDNAGEDQRFGGQSILIQRVRSALCAPLIGEDNRVLGAVYVDNLTTSHRFGEDDLDLLVAFSGIAAIAIENSQYAERIRQEMMVRSNFERYFAPQLAARIASSADAIKLGGDKRHVAVLFSDIRGFTPLSETMNPDALAKLLTEYFTEMVDCVFRHGGTLDKFIGDAVMAQWGAPIGEVDDPDRAMQAAIDMMAALASLNDGWRAQGRPALEIGIGLNYGEAFAGNIGSERRLEFTVIGDTVNTASRLCSAAGGGEILVSDEFRRALKAGPPLEAQPPMELKGKSQPVPVYRVVL